MVGRTNVGGGVSGNSSGYSACIGVTYPEGSICTATNGSITLSAVGTSGLYVFELPEASSLPEAWTIACTNNAKQASQEVTISEEYQLTNVVLKYPRLPDAYQEVEYIQNTYYYSVSLLPSEVKWQTNWEADIEYIIPRSKAAGGTNYEINTIFYLRIGYYYSIGAGSVNGIGASVTYNAESDSSATLDDVPADTKITAVWNDASHRILHNGTVVATLSDTLPGTISWGGCSSLINNSSSNRNLEGRLCSFKIKNTSNDQLLYDFVPCYKKSNSTPGMYDLVNSTFVAVDNKSYFVVGPNV